MKKSLFFTVAVALSSQSLAYQTASNHSYLRNSSFTNNYAADIGGYGDLKLMYLGESGENTRIKFENDLSININLYAESSEILKYGIKIIPYFNNYFGNRINYYAFIDSYYGKFEFGSVLDVTESLRGGADSIAIGPGIINNSLTRHLNLPTRQVNLGNFIFGPGTLMNQNFGYHEYELDRKYWNDSRYLNKINYYLPNIYGLQLGFSLTPNVQLTEKNLQSIAVGANNNFPLGQFFGIAANYIETLWDIGILVSAVSEFNVNNSINIAGGVKEKAAINFRSYDLGLGISYFGLTFSASYGINESNKLTAELIGNLEEGKKSGKYITYGGAYEFSSFSISVNRFESKLVENKFESTNYGVKMNIAKGLAIYMEYFDCHYDYSPTGHPGENPDQIGERARGVLAGVLINF
ncbi:MAG: porin [Rickettsiales bacterium]|jgi:hypothetical protein|nr:porin [Rickettsiales bacterium]